MRIYLPEVKAKRGEAVDYFFEGLIPEHYEPDSPGDGSLKVKITARCSGDQVLISGTLEAQVEAYCCRCLQLFQQRLTSDFMETFTMRPPVAERDNPVLAAAEAANELTVSGDYLYLDEYLRQVFILAQQYYPLCRPDCAGLCPDCGVDLNETSCRCNEKYPVDARLTKLKEFRSGS
ncbi:MAG: DUF177 domain-containing protein [Bacillota bacterium]